MTIYSGFSHAKMVIFHSFLYVYQAGYPIFWLVQKLFHAIPGSQQGSHGRTYVWKTMKPWIPSGEHTKSYGKSPFSMGKSTINGHFQ